MSKMITTTELAQIVTKILVDPDAAGVASESNTFAKFMTDIANVVCDYAGGEVHHKASADHAHNWMIDIHGNDSLPEGGGIWSQYDLEGSFSDDENDTPVVQKVESNTFDFMDQSNLVQKLLDASVATLPFLPTLKGDDLRKALTAFETYGVPTSWSLFDADPDGDHGLTESEKEEAINRFISNYECKEADWDAIKHHAKEVLADRVVCIKVEYDLAFTGGDYSGFGRMFYVPVASIEAAAAELEKSGADDQSEDAAVHLAFSQYSGIEAIHIVHYTSDEFFNQYGDEIEVAVTVSHAQLNARSIEIKDAYLKTSRTTEDDNAATDLLMAECGELYSDRTEAFRFITGCPF